MALVLKDRVKEQTTTTGTGTVTLGGALDGFDTFASVGNGNTTYYAIVSQSANEWEVGIGTYTSSGTTLSRDTILESSNSDSAVNFSAGTKDVFVTYPADKSVHADAAGTINAGAIAAASLTLTTDLAVADGGTGASSLTDGGVLLGSGTGAITPMAVLTDGQMIVGDGSGDPVAESGATLRTSIGVDAAGTDNSTNVTLAGSLDYLTLSGQEITRGAIVLTTDVSGTLPIANGGTNATSAGAALTALGAAPAAGSSNIVTTGALNSGSITSGFGAIDNGSSNITTTGVGTFASLDISGNVDVDGTLETDALSIASTTVTSTAAELNILDGVTSTAAELNILDGVTSTTAELNILDGVTSTAAELNILDGVTSTAAELNILDGVTSTTAELNILDGVTSTAAELNLVDAIARGKILYGNASGASALLSPGSNTQVLTSDGTDISWADASGGGKVLQVVQASTQTQVNSTSTTYADTTLTAAITPSASGSKVLVLVSQSMASAGGAAGGQVAILRGSTVIEEFSQVNNAENQQTNHYLPFLDSPSTTDATTYKTQIKRIDQSGTLQAQRNDASGNATSIITLMEIGA